MSAKREEIRQGEVPPACSRSGLPTLRSEINRLFDRFAGARPELWTPDPFPGAQWQGLGRADLSETETGYELQVDLPGMKRDEVTVNLSDGILTISGERSDEREDKRKGYYLSERSYGSVQRSFRVPDSVEVDQIRAEFKDGVLTLMMPRSEEARESARRIEVE